MRADQIPERFREQDGQWIHDIREARRRDGPPAGEGRTEEGLWKGVALGVAIGALLYLLMRMLGGEQRR
jgi:hypothetical protein